MAAAPVASCPALTHAAPQAPRAGCYAVSIEDGGATGRVEKGEILAPVSFTAYEKYNYLNLASLLQTEKPFDPCQRELLQKIVKKINKDGLLRVDYVQVNSHVGGRLYAKGPSLQYLDKRIRMIVSAESYDFDLVNAHPTLLMQLCKHYRISCPVLLDYVSNRSAWLQEGGDVKTAVISSIYGSQAENPSPKIASLRAEMKAITAALTPHYGKLAAAVAKLKPRAGERKLERTLMSYILQQEEVAVVYKVITQLKREFKGVEIQSYIYDGFMVRKGDGVDPDKILAAINGWVKGNGVCFAIKPFQCPEDFEPLDEDELTPGNDHAALKFMQAKHPHFLKLDGRDRMVYDPCTGMWTKEDAGAFYRLAVKAHDGLESVYGHDLRSMKRVFELMVMLPDDAKFFADSRRDILGKLLFTNGVYDKVKDCRLEFSHLLCFTYRVPHPMPDSEPARVATFDKWMFRDSFQEPGVGDYCRQELTRAIFGLGFETMTFEVGSSSGGKSKRIDAVTKTFGGGLVRALQGQHISVAKFAEPGGPSPKVMVFEHARIVYVSDPPLGMVIDISLMKKITGGDVVTGRGLQQGLSSFVSQTKVWGAVNNLPLFSECEVDFMRKRYRQLESTVKWCLPMEYDELLKNSSEAALAENSVFRANVELTAECINSPDALIWIVMHEPLREPASYTPRSVMNATMETLNERDTHKRKFDECFERNGSSKISSADIMNVLGLAPKALASKMVSWGFGKPKPGRIGDKAGLSCYSGLRLKGVGGGGGVRD